MNSNARQPIVNMFFLFAIMPLMLINY